jgi:GNAT superfamily N-acetyltransferase
MTDSTMRYREMEFADVTPTVIAELNRLLPQLTTSGAVVTPESLEDLFDAKTRVFAAFDGEHIVATVLLAYTVGFTGRKAWIEDVVTDESYRGRRISDKLMTLAEDAAREQLAKSVNLTSRPGRVAARTMYEGRGYTLLDTGVFRKSLL